MYHFKSISEVKLELQSGNAQFGSKLAFFVPCDLKISWMTSKNNRAPLLYTTLSFVQHFKAIGIFKLELQSGNAQFGLKLAIFCPPWPCKNDGWPWKTIGHLSYGVSSFVHYFIATGELKLELQSRNAQYGSKSTIFFSSVNFKFDGWPWKSIGHVF